LHLFFNRWHSYKKRLPTFKWPDNKLGNSRYRFELKNEVIQMPHENTFLGYDITVFDAWKIEHSTQYNT
jgi:hypothetical protein